MIVQKVHVNGFGIFNDLTVEQIPPNLSVIHGENEAGKSTLLAFFRTMLFGFPDGRSNENSYPPLHGGAPGGSITVEASDGQPYIVERRPGPRGGAVRVTLPDGRLGDGKALEQLLGFATRDLYRNIFAFSLSELQQFETLGDERVKTTIYSAGLGTGKLSLPAIDRELGATQDELFKPRGSNPTINRIMRDLDGVRGKLKAAANHITEYDALHRSLEQVDARIAVLRKDSETAARQFDRSSRLLAAWNDWVALCQLEQELAGLPDPASFPLDGESQLDHIEEKLDEVAAGIRKQALHLRTKQEDLDSIALDERVLECGPEILRLQRGRDHYDSAVQDLPKIGLQRDNAEEGLRDALRELGPDWDKDKIVTFNTSIPEREAVRGHRDALRHAGENLLACQQRLELLKKAADTASEVENDAAKALEAAPEPAEKNLDVITARIRKLRELVSQVRERRSLDEKVAHFGERETDLELQRQRAEEQMRKAGMALSMWPALAVFLIGVGVGLVLLVVGGWVVGVLAILALGIAVPAIYLLVRRQLSARAVEERQKTGAYTQSIERRLDEIRAQRTGVRDWDSGLKAKIVQQSESLHLPDQLDEATIENLCAEAEVAQETARQWTGAKRSLDQASAQAKAARYSLDEARATLDEAKRALTEARAKWAEWLVSAGLRPGVSPEGALEIIGRIGECRTRAKTAEDFQKRVDLIDAFIRDYCREVASVAERCGRVLSDADDAGAALDQSIEQLEAAQEARRRQTDLRNEINSLQLELEGLQTRREEIGQELDGLLTRGGAICGEEFRVRAGIWTRRQELARETKQRNMALEIIAGQGEYVAALKRELSSMAPDEEERRKQEARTRRSDIEEAWENAHSERGAIRNRLSDLESEDKAGELRLDEQRLLAQLREAARKWAAHTIARAILTEAKERYERERQPGVIRDSSSFFTKITRQQYPQILASPEESTLQVVDARGYRKKMGELSRGTQEQLYLAVRLGLIREFSQRQESLPVMMDDILVNFDPRRAEASLDAVLELASTHQVLLFTCHPETCARVRDLAPATPIFELVGGQLTLQMSH